MTTSLTQKSYSQIRTMLVRGDLAPGERLVTRSLASKIGVSLAPVREALNRLASEGLVEHVPGAGAFVRNADRQDLEEIYVLRDATESCAAAEAAKNITDDQIEELDAIVDDWVDIAKNIPDTEGRHATQKQLDRWLDNEETFHEILVEASRNRLLAKVINEYRAISSVFSAQRHHPAILTRHVADRTCNDRRELMDALREHDPLRARTLMSDQIQKGKRTVLRFLRELSRKP
ncbi:MAG: GntR family transcriptional regulator [Verrucomicrobiota bacterium]